jgi:predicted dehydrogenase
MVAVADLNQDAAKAAAEKHDIPHVLTVEELLAHDDIEIVLNLTTPQHHVSVCEQALDHGKHTYVEKPLGVDREDGRRLMEKSKATGLRVGVAPDTFLGAGIQTARKTIDDGKIGRPIGFSAQMLCPGHETWHPNPEFYYAPGGGPMLDMGPYYLTALLNLLGPIKRLAGLTSIAKPDRTITSEPLKGKKIDVQTPDHYVGIIEFEGGASGTIAQSFAVKGSDHDGKRPIRIWGTEGTMRVGDPNNFDVPPQLQVDDDWEDVPLAIAEGYGRSVGLADLAHAVRENRPHRCSIEQAFCVLDAMLGFRDSSESGRFYEMKTPYERPAAIKAGGEFGNLS